jgi:hypothetical protein
MYEYCEADFLGIVRTVDYESGIIEDSSKLPGNVTHGLSRSIDGNRVTICIRPKN